jgi:glycosyltransferase involved in cell wall biosynthesis
MAYILHKAPNRMNIVHIFKDCFPPTTGGIEQHMSLLCRRLSQYANVTMMAPSRSRARIEEQVDNVRIVRIPEFGRLASVPLCPTAPFELRRLRPDLVHLHFPNPMGDFAQLLGASKVPFVVTYHADIIRQKIFVPLYRPVLKRLFNKASKILISAKENLSFSLIEPEHRTKCAVIPFGIEMEDFIPRDQEAKDAVSLRREFDDPVVLFVGAARYYKGLNVLLRSMVQAKGRLLLAGRGTQDPSLKRMAADLGVSERIRFFGEVSPSQLRILLHAADVFVLPSIDRCETFGIGQLEAMACSKPVISTDLPTGVRSVNRHGITGLVVPPGDVEALTGAINTLLSDPQLCAELGNAARRRVESEFSADIMVSKTLEVYHEVLGHPAKRAVENSGSSEAGS